VRNFFPNLLNLYKNQGKKGPMKKIVIIGAGIAGLSAAIYNARANLEPVVIAGPTAGGQLTETTEVENFPGFEHGILGPELINQATKQAERFGTQFVYDSVTRIEKTHTGFNVHLQNQPALETQAVIIATGASARWLNIPSEQLYKGKGVSACATCDGFFFKNKDVIVIGGGDSAMEEATHLTKFAKSVTLVHRKDTFRASPIMQTRALQNPKIRVIWNSEIIEYTGDEKKLTGVVLKDLVTQNTTRMPIDGVFLAIGHVPNSSFAKELVDVDPVGYIVTDRYTQTKTPGLFACGDVADNRYRQAITAAGTGCAASLEAQRYIEHLEHKH
jgi:thioredoxin reductase (NADPH)